MRTRHSLETGCTFVVVRRLPVLISRNNKRNVQVSVSHVNKKSRALRNEGPDLGKWREPPNERKYACTVVRRNPSPMKPRHKSIATPPSNMIASPRKDQAQHNLPMWPRPRRADRRSRWTCGRRFGLQPETEQPPLPRRSVPRLERAIAIQVLPFSRSPRPGRR